MQDSKNLIFAIVLSTIILFCWQYFYAGPRLAEVQRQQKIAQELKEKNAKPQINDSSQTTENAVDVPAVIKDRSEVLNDINRIKINTNKLHGSISLTGARFDDLTLIEHNEKHTKNSDEVVLLSPSGSKRVYFAEFGWVSGDRDTIVPDSKTIWNTQSRELTSAKPVLLSWDNNKGLKFFIKIAIDENYLFTITKSVENYDNESHTIFPYGRINRARPEQQSFYISHEGPIGSIDGKLSEVSYDDIKSDKKMEFENSKGWLGIADKYWLTTLIPSQGIKFDANYSYSYRNDQDRYQVDYLAQKIQIASGQTASSTSNLFAGPKEVNLLDKYGEELGMPLFDRTVDFGILYFITKPIYRLLTVFYGFVGNFGIAIMMLTVLLKLLLFPLANKSYISMHRLKTLQPQMMDLKERYKNDKVAMNKAVMELYKKEKVNPMSGCLPIFVQIPIFFALYKVLFVTIEMRHAPFFGWIKDLSAPDPTTIFNLFGLIPYTPPQMLMVGVWPIVMGITMFLQQKMNPAPTDPTQAKIMKFLPLLFTFMLSTFPAGLVIYWAWNNALSILQQWVITRRLPK